MDDVAKQGDLPGLRALIQAGGDVHKRYRVGKLQAQTQAQAQAQAQAQVREYSVRTSLFRTSIFRTFILGTPQCCSQPASMPASQKTQIIAESPPTARTSGVCVG